MGLFPAESSKRRARSSLQRKQVALLIETSNEYARGLLNGIRAFTRERRLWSIYLNEYSRDNTDFTWLNGWRGDGIIARIENEQTARYILDAGFPAVDLSAFRIIPSLPYVETDDRAIARLAAEHFLERGFKNFGFYGDSRFPWSKQRGAYFEDYLGALPYDCHTFISQQSHDRASRVAERHKLIQWLHSLPKPIGIMACYDSRGQQLLEACRFAEIAVPDEIAVIGVDNDEVLCELSDPPLTSIQSNAVRTGYLAAELLERMMAGEDIGAEAHLIEPLSIQVRMSTDVLAVDDKLVSEAVRFIREHAHEDIQVQDILSELSVSRRILDSRFKKALGRTPHEEIIAVKVKDIKKLLVETKLPLSSIAEITGFNHTEYMSVVFTRTTGIRPGQYREENRLST
ncbi:xylose operon transcription regulator XylR [Cohnella cellulosilytica]|uniref:Substrate-binding domain-containing protein n=1 Tax=Cohnella cellulosilytica TaxID=986710 RepID=A0ABW2FLI8_9BACL